MNHSLLSSMSLLNKMQLNGRVVHMHGMDEHKHAILGQKQNRTDFLIHELCPALLNEMSTIWYTDLKP